MGVSSLLTLWLVLLFGISARQVVGVLGAVGTPALMVALLAAGWWASSRILPTVETNRQVQPLRTALLVYGWYLLLTVALGHMRPLTALEETGSIRALIRYVSLAGIALLVMDGTSSLADLRTILRRLVWAGAGLSLVGLLQFLTGAPWQVDVPLLVYNHEVVGVDTRSIFNRPFGNALHPIEFSVVLAALFPVALHMALEASADRRLRRRLGAAAGVIGLGIPIAISRSGVVVFGVSMIVLFAGWSWRRRMNAALTGMVALPALWLLVPGLVGTLRSLFTNAEYDPSIQHRLERVPRMLELLREHPWFGRGFGTYSVEDYFLLDNQIYVSAIELGLVGLALTAALFGLAMLAARTSRHHPFATRETRHLGLAVVASIAGIVASFATFDAFHYHILMGVLFVLVGVAGATWGLTRSSALLEP